MKFTFSNSIVWQDSRPAARKRVNYRDKEEETLVQQSIRARAIPIGEAQASGTKRSSESSASSSHRPFGTVQTDVAKSARTDEPIVTREAAVASQSISGNPNSSANDEDTTDNNPDEPAPDSPRGEGTSLEEWFLTKTCDNAN